MWEIQNSTEPSVKFRYKKCRAKKLECGKWQELYTGFDLLKPNLYFDFHRKPQNIGILNCNNFLRKAAIRMTILCAKCKAHVFEHVTASTNFFAKNGVIIVVYLGVFF